MLFVQLLLCTVIYKIRLSCVLYKTQNIFVYALVRFEPGPPIEIVWSNELQCYLDMDVRSLCAFIEVLFSQLYKFNNKLIWICEVTG